MTPGEAADRLAIRELIDGYSHCADRRDCDGGPTLFSQEVIPALRQAA
jgi:hypothetical protein